MKRIEWKKKIVFIIMLATVLSAAACNYRASSENLPDSTLPYQSVKPSSSAAAEPSVNSALPAAVDSSNNQTSSPPQEISSQEDTNQSPDPEPERKPVVLAFAGDINFADNWDTMQELHRRGGDLSTCISRPLLERMNAADIFLLNNEFAFSDRGSPMEGKAYTFRAKTEHVNYLLEMGVDIVTLGNNHVYDYGKDAFYDTLDTLTEAGIGFVGAGRNLAEAMDARYFTINDITFAYVAASRAEKNIMTPAAKENSPGILRTYDSTLFLEAIRSARDNADVVIAVVHWGTEYSYVLEEAQTKLARELIDNGADLIIGSHPHCLQGIEYYKDKPIIYSLGNLWFNNKSLDTALLEVAVYSPDELVLTVVPCLQEDLTTTILTDDSDRRRVFELLESISPNQDIIIDDGMITVTK